MSSIPPCNVSDAEVLLNMLYNTVGSHLLGNVQENIHKLLPKTNSQGEPIPVSAELINTSLKSLKLLVEMLEWSCRLQGHIDCGSGIQDILQYLRDILEVDYKTTAVVNASLELLQSVCKFALALKDGNSHIETCSNFYLFNLRLLNQPGHDESYQTARLRVISVMLETVAKSKIENCMHRFKEKCRSQCDGVVDVRILESLVATGSEAVSAQVLLSIVPHFVIVFGSTSILQTIWNNAITESDPGNDVKRFSTLCYLFDVFASTESATDSDSLFPLLQDERYWKTVQYGLLHDVSGLRRQALYLMKRSVQEMHSRDWTLSSVEMNEISGANFVEKLDGGVIKLSNGMKNIAIANNKAFLVSNGQESIMWWHHVLKNELSSLYNDVFLVYETLEEKQSHLVKPIFQTVMRLIGPTLCPFRNGRRLHLSWILVLFRRILSHDNAAVVRWGLINTPEIDLSLCQTPQLLRTIVNMFVSHFNNPSVFVNEIDQMRSELSRYFNAATAYPQFFQVLFEEISSVNWCPETLIILLDSLQDVKVLSWDSSQLLLMKKFVTTSIATHYTFLRAAIQCYLINCIINLTDVSKINLEILADVFGSFRGHECLQRGSSTWTLVSKWIEYCFSKKNAQDFLLKNVAYQAEHYLDPTKIARMICLLYDAHLFGIMKCCGEEPTPEIHAVMTRLFQFFKNADKRLYADQKVLIFNLQLIRGILKETLVGDTPQRSHLIEVMLPNFPDILAYITSRAGALVSVADYEQASLFVDMLDLIMRGQKLFRINSEQFTIGIFNFSLESLGVYGVVTQPPIVKYIGMKFLKLLFTHYYQDTTVPKLKMLQAILKHEVNVSLDSHGDENSSWGRINTEYLEAQWCVVNRLKSEKILKIGASVKVEQFLTSVELANCCISALELGGGSLVVTVLKVAEEILPDLEELLLEQLVQACWTSLWELRRSEVFAPATHSFISMLFQPEIVGKNSSNDILYTYSSLLLTQSVNGVANAFLKHIQSLQIKYSAGLLWQKVLAAALTFGDLCRRDDKLTHQVSALVASLPACAANELVQNDWNNSCEVRARAVQILLTLSPEKHSSFADGIMDQLLSNDLELSSTKSRLFSGSSVNLKRTRMLQALLILEPLISKEKAVFLYNWLCALLLRESQQPSARYLAEWLLVRLIRRYNELQSAVWANFTEALEQRVGSLCSFISIVYHSTAVVAEDAIAAWLDKAMLQFLPYYLAQHFSLRLYAQIVLEKMWLTAESKGLQSFLEKYRIMRDCQMKTIGNGNAIRNADKLRQDFYWTTFHPVLHYSLATIFRDLPRLAHVKQDEWITPQLFTKVGVPVPVSLVPMSSGDALWLHPIANWNTRNDDTFMEVPSDNFQKKLIPVKSLLPDYDAMLDESIASFSRKQRVESDGLVVVASLVDRAANLGGLCRTCEAFGVSKLVIDTLQILQDKQFQSLAVTSEKWVHITEVKTYHLADFLLKMKGDGYTIVGAEQTSRCVPLQQAVMPRKCLLLLGSEKEGIPPQLLSLLDICIEVPQLGVVRSLNVHVTGALCIWEYAKQHAFVQTPP